MGWIVVLLIGLVSLTALAGISALRIASVYDENTDRIMENKRNKPWDQDMSD